MCVCVNRVPVSVCVCDAKPCLYTRICITSDRYLITILHVYHVLYSKRVDITHTNKHVIAVKVINER